MPKNCLIKLSGDVIQDNVLAWIGELAQHSFVVVCAGGGTQINQAFVKAGFPIGVHGPLGRETGSFQERQLARDVLERNQAEIQDRLAAAKIHAVVVIPVLEIGTVLCHVNGDQFVLSAYHGFDQLLVMTTPGREAKKKEFFAPYKKVRVVSLPP